MRILTLDPSLKGIRFAYFPKAPTEPAEHHGSLPLGPGPCYAESASSALTGLHGICTGDPELVALRAVHGADVLPGPTLVSPKILAELEKVVGSAPLHLPILRAVASAVTTTFASIPVLLLPETAFFRRLPERERRYGLDPQTTRTLNTQRSGYHGLLHQAACAEVAAQRFTKGLRAPARVLSICLERQPEVAAVRGTQPLMVTSGATPLEGLPGETRCGELDPGIVLQLVKHAGLAPEQIDALLTKQSGVSGLVGQPVSLAEALEGTSERTELAHQVLCYRILLACGSGVAAMGGLDALVFSGRYADRAGSLASQLRHQLALAQGLRTRDIERYHFDRSLPQVMAGMAAAHANQQGPRWPTLFAGDA